METLEFNDIETASPSVVKSAARSFAAALSETPQFRAFEQAYEAFDADTAARQALSAYKQKAQSLRALLMLNAVSEADRAELERLQNAYLSRPSVQAYMNAELELAALCRELAGLISQSVGLNYAASCGASCCG